jgi:hypothetical protein
LCINFFSNNIFTRRYWIHSPPICIPIVFYWMWIQFNWILIQLLNCIELKFNHIEFKFLNWIQIHWMDFNFILEGINVFHINNILKKFLAPQLYLLFPCFSMFLVLLQIRRIYCMLHIASNHHYPLAKIHLSQGYFNISCHGYMNMSFLCLGMNIFFLLHCDLCLRC